jgi:DNA-binding CsgD family transcriptional regulator
MNNLTVQQTIIVRLVRSGLSNKQIARELGIREGTVKQHLHTIYDKLGIASRYKLIIGQSPNTKNVSPTIRETESLRRGRWFYEKSLRA